MWQACDLSGRMLTLAVCVGLLWRPGAASVSPCICASTILSCSKMNLSSVPTGVPAHTAVLDLSHNDIKQLKSEWTTSKLPKLRDLLLSHNGMLFLSSEAFVNVKQLRHLDLSSNSLRQLDEFVFEPLVNLEVLLLYDNKITQIEHSAFVTTLNIQKLYLSHNQISRFPAELIREKSRLEKLSLLDVSSNRIKKLPLDEMGALPAWLRNGLYFHNNPLPCHCDLYTLVAHWDLRKLNSVADFRDEFTCVLPGPRKTRVDVFELSGDSMNCSTFKEAEEEAFLEQTLTLACDTKGRNVLKTWTLPGTPGDNQTALVLPDGSLRLSPIRSEDSGTYTCFATSEAFNETIYVVLKVHNFTMHGGNETLNTAYTTLVGCLASVVLVLVYLYLTPCHCFCCPGKGRGRGDDSIRSSVLSVTPTHGGDGRHVVFTDTKEAPGQNGKVNPDLERDGPRDEEGRSLMKGTRKKSLTDSISSVFSDTPMMV
ncbi:amphoterin-induced protein 1 [Stigmatopora nigra]